MLIHIAQQNKETGEVHVLSEREIKTRGQLDRFLAETKKKHLLKDKKVLLVLNKLDLGITLNERQLNFNFASCVSISAKSGDRIDQLLKEIPKVLGVSAFELNSPICFTQRQYDLLESLSRKKTKAQAKAVIAVIIEQRNATSYKSKAPVL